MSTPRSKTLDIQTRREIIRMWLRRPLRPIRNDADHDKAVAVAESLDRQKRLSRFERDYLEVLLILIDKYENEHHEIDTSDLSPIEILQFLMEQHDMNASDLGRVLGNRALGSKILRGERDLSKVNIQKLSAYFNVNPGLFLKTKARALVDS